jgi:hypothetical protein
LLNRLALELPVSKQQYKTTSILFHQEMDRLFSDPSLLVCPDFMSARYQATRVAMITANVTEAQAAETLRNTWVLTNEDLCLQWREQVAEDERLSAERKRAADEEAERERLALQLEENTA